MRKTHNLLILLVAVAAVLPASPSGDTIPLFFIANQGQAPPEVRFMAQGSGSTAFFLPGEAHFRVGDATVRVQFSGAREGVQLEGADPLPGRANFLTGEQEQWRVGVPLFGGVIYRQLYPGIDMRYGGNGRNLKSEFVVSPGADVSQIRLRYQGDGVVYINDQGALVIPVNGRELIEQPPTLYQDSNGKRVAVPGRFLAREDDAVGFEVGDYDPSLPLIIDPVLQYSTLLGGASSDAVNALAVDSTGAAYVAGFTASYDFPTANPEQGSNAGSNDVLVAKLSPAGDSLVYCTYIGGRSDDRAFGIAVDSAGSAYVTGWTTSSNFPVRSPLQSTLKGVRNAFVLKLNPSGNSLVFSTYLGGNASDMAYGISLDSSQNVYIVGDTTSMSFPASGLQKNNHGGQDAFIAKFSADGSQLVYSTYLGGVSDDHGAAIAVATGGVAYVTGSTYSADFPVAGAFQATIGGGQDAFVAKLSADGKSLVFSTFLGGSGGALGYPESGQAIALDAQANAYVAGVTGSSNFPLLHPAQAARRGSSVDAFAAKLTSGGTLSYSTYLGGTGVDSANGVVVDPAGNAYVVGQTFSYDLPVINAYQGAIGGDYDAFCAKLSAAGDSLSFLTYMGGSGSDTATSVALDSAGNLYIAGWTLSPNFPVLNGYQSINSGNYGAFVEKLVLGTPPSAVSVSPASGTGLSQVFSFQFSDPAGAGNLTSASILFNSSLSTTSACSVQYIRAANTLILLTDAGTASGSPISPGSGSMQNSQCTLNGSGSSVTISGNLLTLNLSLAFQAAAFGGAKNVYLQASSPIGLSGWQQLGAWSVPFGPPAPVSVIPNSGSGSSQLFTVAFTDAKGYSAITYVSVLVNSTLTGVGGCYILYYPATRYVYLANDAVTSWTGPVALGQAGNLQNSHCSVNTAASSASGSGTGLTLNLSLAFQPAFGGARKFYAQVYDGIDSGLQQLGSWTVPSGTPTPVSVTPSSGTGSSQTFSLVFSDPKGYSSLVYVSTLINGSLSGVSGCYLLYYPASKALYLASDAATAWNGPVNPGQAGTLQNSQCSVNSAASSAAGSGTNLTLNLALSFQPVFGGARKIYMQAYDGLDSGLQQLGTWTIPAGAPAPVSVSPASGSGSSQSFNFVFTDPKGYQSLSYASVLINNSLTGVGGCYLLYYPGPRSLYLANDAVTAWTGPATPGQSATLQNTHCTVDLAGSSASGSGSNLTLNLALIFKPAFAGSKKVYLQANDGQDSGLQQLGAWTVP